MPLIFVIVVKNHYLCTDFGSYRQCLGDMGCGTNRLNKNLAIFTFSKQ